MDVRTASRLSLRAPGAVLLISCYELGHQPLGIALPIALLTQAGYDPACIDLAQETLDEDAVRRARFVGMSAPMHTALRIGVQTSREIRQLNPEAHIAFYGLYASLNAEYLLRDAADSCIGGNYEPRLLELVDALERGGAAPEGVEMSGGSHTPILDRLVPLVPRRDLLPSLDRYAKLDAATGTRVAGYVEASRGCLHSCRHCPIPPVYGGRFFVFPREQVIADIAQQAAAGAEHITFGDPDFLNGPGHSLGVVREMRKRFPGLSFDCTVKVEHILERPEVFRELRDCGCVFVVSAAESLSENVLEILQKGHTKADVAAAVGILRDAGLEMRPTWVPFTPWTTIEDILEIYEFVSRHDLIGCVDPVQYSIRLLVPPGSLLADHASMRPFRGDLDQAGFSYVWRHPDARMDRLQEASARLVEEADGVDEDATETFYRLWELAAKAGERPAPRRSTPSKRRVPRLTEPWFC